MQFSYNFVETYLRITISSKVCREQKPSHCYKPTMTQIHWRIFTSQDLELYSGHSLYNANILRRWELIHHGNV